MYNHLAIANKGVAWVTLLTNCKIVQTTVMQNFQKRTLFDNFSKFDFL